MKINQCGSIIQINRKTNNNEKWIVFFFPDARIVICKLLNFSSRSVKITCRVSGVVDVGDGSGLEENDVCVDGSCAIGRMVRCTSRGLEEE